MDCTMTLVKIPGTLSANEERKAAEQAHQEAQERIDDLKRRITLLQESILQATEEAEAAPNPSVDSVSNTDRAETASNLAVDRSASPNEPLTAEANNSSAFNNPAQACLTPLFAVPCPLTGPGEKEHGTWRLQHRPGYGGANSNQSLVPSNLPTYPEN